MYAIIADAHLGHINNEYESFLFEKLADLRNEGLKIIWLGDTFDLIWSRTAYAVYNKILKNGDTIIIGNHDFSLIQNNVGVRKVIFENTAITHGDYLDFGYFTARLEHFWYNLKHFDVTLLEVLAKLFYTKWTFKDVHDIFLLMENLDKKILKMFSHDPKYPHNLLSELLELLKLFRKLKKYLKSTHIDLPVHNPTPPLPKPAKDGYMFGYFTFNAEELYKRYKKLYEQDMHKKTIIIGHIHKPMDEITEDGTRFVVAGSWQQSLDSGIYPTVPILDGHGDIIEIREYR